MKVLAQEAANDLYFFYQMWLQHKEHRILRLLAERLHTRYHGTTPILDEKMQRLIAKLIDFYIDTGIPYMTDDEIQQTMIFLKQHYQELEK